jgi:hypothetical protein
MSLECVFFGGLGLRGKFSRRAICQCRVRSVVVVVVQPESQLLPGIGQAEEHLHIQDSSHNLPLKLSM